MRKGEQLRYGVCVICLQEVKLRDDGFPWRHGRERLYLPAQAPCPGSYRQAALFSDSDATIERKARAT